LDARARRDAYHALVPTIFVGLFMIALSLFQLMAPGAWWKFHAWGKRAEGVQATRTPEWESARVVLAVVLLVVGVILLLIGLQEEPRRRPPDLFPYPQGPPPAEQGR
jgi:hypothetical protein